MRQKQKQVVCKRLFQRFFISFQVSLNGFLKTPTFFFVFFFCLTLHRSFNDKSLKPAIN